MYVTTEIIREVKQRYGTPVEIAREYEMTPEQLGVVRLGMKQGRCHDVTLVIVDDERNIVVIRKPSYPLGAYRTPSGGVEFGESFDDGAIREAKEETGLDIVLEKYLIRAKVRFRCGLEVIDWTTHVLQARPTGGTLQPIDTKEIVEARKATITEITGPIREVLLGTGSPGLQYRAELDGLAIELICGEIQEFPVTNIVHIDESNYAHEYALSIEAIRDFLYMCFEISSDCLPTGDWGRAELGSVDPYRYLDVRYSYRYQFRSDDEITFMHHGAAINLLCRVCQVYDQDECSESKHMYDFNTSAMRNSKDSVLRQHSPDLFRIHEAFLSGRIVATESVQAAFVAAFSNNYKYFLGSLQRVLNDVIITAFDRLKIPKLSRL